VSEKFGCKLLDNTDELDVYGIMQMGGRGAPGMVTDDSVTS